MGINQYITTPRAVFAACVMSIGAIVSLGASPRSEALSMKAADKDGFTGRGEIYYAGSSNEELATVVTRALNQLSEFRDVKQDGSNVIVGFDDSRLIISCIASTEVPDRLCATVLWGCKASVKPDDPKLLKLINGLNAKYNTAAFSVIAEGKSSFLQVQSSLSFLNYLSKDMLLMWCSFFEGSCDAVIELEKERLDDFIK